MTRRALRAARRHVQLRLYTMVPKDDTTVETVAVGTGRTSEDSLGETS